MNNVIIRIIADEESWSKYMELWPVSRREHSPQIPPEYPVLVVSSLICPPLPYLKAEVEHSFLTAPELRRFIGLEVSGINPLVPTPMVDQNTSLLSAIIPGTKL